MGTISMKAGLMALLMGYTFFISIALNYYRRGISIKIWDWKSLFVKVKVSKINGIGSQFNDDIAIKLANFRFKLFPLDVSGKQHGFGSFAFARLHDR